MLLVTVQNSRRSSQDLVKDVAGASVLMTLLIGKCDSPLIQELNSESRGLLILQATGTVPSRILHIVPSGLLR
jgi:hypothetical protein